MRERENYRVLQTLHNGGCWKDALNRSGSSSFRHFQTIVLATLYKRCTVHSAQRTPYTYERNYVPTRCVWMQPVFVERNMNLAVINAFFIVIFIWQITPSHLHFIPLYTQTHTRVLARARTQCFRLTNWTENAIKRWRRRRRRRRRQWRRQRRQWWCLLLLESGTLRRICCCSFFLFFFCVLCRCCWSEMSSVPLFVSFCSNSNTVIMCSLNFDVKPFGRKQVKLKWAEMWRRSLADRKKRENEN